MSLGKVSVAIEAQMASFESDMGRAARVAEKEFKKIERDAKQAQEQMKRVGKAIGMALVAGATAAAVAIKGAINAMDDMSKAAQRANMPTEDFSRLAYAGSLADVSMEDLTGSLGKLAKAQGDAMRATSVQARVFEGLGIAVKNVDGSMRSTSDVFKDFADVFQQMKGSPEIMAAGMNIFGRSFQKLIPLMKDGADGLEAAGVEADKLGQTLSTEAGRQAEAFNDDLTRLQAAASGLALAVAQELMPDLLKLSSQFVSTATNGQRTAETAKDIGDAIRTAGEIVSFVGGYFTAFGDVIEGTTEGMIGLYEAAAGLVTLDWNRIKAGMAVANEGADLAYYGGGNDKSAGGPDFSDVRSGSSTKLSIEAQAAAIKAQRAQAELLRKALGDPDPKAKPGKSGGTAKKSGTSALQTAARDAQKARDELERLVEQVERAGAEFDAMAASLAGPLSEAAYRFSVEQERLNELARDGEIDAGRLQAAQGQLRAEYEKNVEAIKAQLTPAQEAQAAIQEEIKLLGMSAQAQEIYNNLKAAGVEANSEFGKSITASTQELQAMREQAAFMADVQFGLSDAFVEMASGAKSAKEAFGDFADQLFARALQFVADKAIQAMFDAFSNKGAAAGGTAGGSGWAGMFSAVMGAFGGGRANGGSVSGSSFYEVGENNRPELLAVKGKQYLIPGNAGNVTPIRGGGGAFTQVIHQNYAAPNDPRTRDQMASKVAFETQRTMARNR